MYEKPLPVNYTSLSPEQYYTPSSEPVVNLPSSEPVENLSRPVVNPNEPWTGVWDLKCYLGDGISFVIKQNGKTVKSTIDSTIKFSGTAEGNTLKGWIDIDSGWRRKCSLKISSDNKSFKGSLRGNNYGPTSRLLYGKRR
jgi:hypothetical protein